MPDPTDILTQFDIPEMLKVYSREDNYEVVDFDNRDNRCFIFFSSHGLYYPNTPETFHQAVVENDRYEWRRNMPSFVRRVILVRDVTKQWYLDGISAHTNTIELLMSVLRQETAGMKVVCVGSSAGGYAAVLFGCLLNASHVFSFSGQFSLLPYLWSAEDRALNPTLVRYESIAAYRKYFSLRPFLAETAPSVFYFYPARCREDVVQRKFAEGLDCVHAFAIDRDGHGATILQQNFMPLFAMSVDRLESLHESCAGKVLSAREFSVKACGRTLTYRALFKSRMRRLLRGK